MKPKTKEEFFKWNEKKVNILDKGEEYVLFLLVSIIPYIDMIGGNETTKEMKAKYSGIWKYYINKKNHVVQLPYIDRINENICLVFAEDGWSAASLDFLKEYCIEHKIRKIAIEAPRGAIPAHEIFGSESMELLICIDDEGELNIIDPDMEKQNFNNKSKYI